MSRFEVQSRTFTRWCNTFLEERMLKIIDVERDFNDGVLFVNLLEIISSKTIIHNKKPKIRPQKLENCQNAMQFLKKEGIKLISIDAYDLVDGSLKFILGLLWTIILHYQFSSLIQDGYSSKQNLLNWIRSKIPEYKINNLTSDWQDGKAICALVDAFLRQINFLQFSNNPLQDATMGIQTAAAKMKIPPILDANDMVYNPDELSNMTYLIYFHHYELCKASEMWPESHKVLSKMCQEGIVEMYVVLNGVIPKEIMVLIIKVVILLWQRKNLFTEIRFSL